MKIHLPDISAQMFAGLNLAVLMMVLIAGLIFIIQHLGINENVGHAIAYARYLMDYEEQADKEKAEVDKKAAEERAFLINTVKKIENKTIFLEREIDNKLDRIQFELGVPVGDETFYERNVSNITTISPNIK